VAQILHAEAMVRVTIAVMPRLWIFNREDPRTVLLGTVFVLVVGSFTVVRVGDGFGLFTPVFVVGWFVLSVGQFLWAVIRYRRWRARVRDSVGDGGAGQGPEPAA